jgi:pantetheine-phosphate adenylyltransferase
MRKALFAGSFDPPTLGHLDLIRRARALFDALVVAVGVNPAKGGAFGLELRVEWLRRALAAERIDAEVASFRGLAVEFARSCGASCLVRGARGAADFEFEAAMAQMNRRLSPGLDTLLLVPAPEFAAVSARLVREVGALGGDLKGLIPPAIHADVARRLLGKGD